MRNGRGQALSSVVKVEEVLSHYPSPVLTAWLMCLEEQMEWELGNFRYILLRNPINVMCIFSLMVGVFIDSLIMNEGRKPLL